MHLPGLFITIEGVEGSGKTTLAAKLGKYLSLRGCDVVVTEEPGGDAVANQIRRVVLDAGNEITDRSELLLFEAARAQHVDKKIIPALERGAVVISDRYADSSAAYQAGARGIEPETVKMLNEFATHCLRPDITFLLDLPTEVGLAREEGSDRVSQESREFHEEVRAAYLAIAEREQDRFVVIDATLGVEEVLRQASHAIEKFMPSVDCNATSTDS
jgi:dTMP kinase